jgi:hypothetical protein
MTLGRVFLPGLVYDGCGVGAPVEGESCATAGAAQ